ncbi:hypothetical protein CsSME_00051109 [Camellia sinensis var. sinensis]|uniref:Uncharacterized protein n=1 Tax=Camellia sinensis var. sinensis TaxID=542762 RepID=A0A4S4EV43_CAMSN|nr:hypothetical protein TEA_016268 [Camellia sinensis var. sinensis]
MPVKFLKMTPSQSQPISPPSWRRLFSWRLRQMRGILFVRKLVALMRPEALALTDYFGNTALHAVAVLGNIIEAKLVVEKNPDFPNIWNNDGSLPLHLAAMHGQRKMTLFLLSVTRDDEESKPYEGEAGATLMRFAINVGFYSEYY